MSVNYLDNLKLAQLQIPETTTVANHHDSTPSSFVNGISFEAQNHKDSADPLRASLVSRYLWISLRIMPGWVINASIVHETSQTRPSCNELPDAE